MSWWLVAVAAVWWWALPHSGRREVRARLVKAGRRIDRPSSVERDRVVRRPAVDASSPVVRAAGAVGASLAPLLLVGGATGTVFAAVTAAGVWWFVGRLEPSSARRRREAIGRELPFAVDLLAACLAAGATPSDALRAAGAVLDGETGEAFLGASSALSLGAPIGEALAAWRAGGSFAELAPVARMLERSSASGAALVPSVSRLASEIRSSRRWEVDAIARRAGVRATVPLGVCFLPAFVLLGVVPTVLAGARVFVS